MAHLEVQITIACSPEPKVAHDAQVALLDIVNVVEGNVFSGSRGKVVSLVEKDTFCGPGLVTQLKKPFANDLLPAADPLTVSNFTLFLLLALACSRADYSSKLRATDVRLRRAVHCRDPFRREVGSAPRHYTKGH